jgi:hypothetical protein
MPRYWIGVAARDHVQLGTARGFAQLGHGKAGGLRRLAAGDWLAYYSSRLSYPDGPPCQCFTALGRVRDGRAYQPELLAGGALAGGGRAMYAGPGAADPLPGLFANCGPAPGAMLRVPWRLDVDWLPVVDAPIAPLLAALDFIPDKQRWGAPFRYGLVEVGQTDLRRIAAALNAPQLP